MSQERNFNKLLLTALLIGAVGSAWAQEFSTGLFSVSPTKQVYLAKTNLTGGASGFYTWDEAHALIGCELLTEDEWHFLLQSRCGGQKEAYELYALGCVNGTNGLVILPDAEVWHWPTEALRLAWNNYNTQHGYEKNTYTSEQWALMETNGAVFLPAAGYWTGTAVEDANLHGSYWIDTEDEGNPTTKAYRLKIENNEVNELITMPKSNYYSVRTVQTASEPIKLSEYDQPEVFAVKKAALSGETSVGIYRTLRKAGCFNTLTLPFNVPNIASSPLAGAEVYEFAGAAVEGDALQLDITPLVGSSLTAGTPYLIQWPNNGQVLFDMTFDGITWDDDQSADDAGSGDVALRGFYGRTHIDDDVHGTTHLNLFLMGNNQLYWPTDGSDPSAKMLGFRAWFQIDGGSIAGAPVYHGMPATLRIVSTTTDVEQITNDLLPMTNKVIKDGQLIINRNGEQYSITGQKL